MSAGERGSLVVDLDSIRRVWRAGRCICGLCGHRWAGVVRLPRWWGLECPACGTAAGVCLEAGVEAVE